MLEYKSETCRVCLQTESNKCISLFDNYKDNVISDHLKSIAAVEIDADDELPQGICPDCLLQLDNALEFKRKCELSDKILHNGAQEHDYATTDEVSIEDKPEIRVNNIIETLKEENESIKDENESECNDNIIEHTEYLDKDDVTETNEVLERKSRAIDLQLICDDCGWTFKSKCKIKVHWRKVHLPEKLTCHMCKRTFPSYKALHRHEKERSNACLVASKVKVECLGKIRIFHCTYCPFKSKKIHCIDAHLVTHTKEKRFQCKICGKSYTQLSGLLNHESVHKDIKNSFPCYICGKLFKSRIKTNDHIRKRHILNTPSKCTVCDKVCKSKQTLSVHMLRHSGVKANKCDICGADYYSSAELITHRKRAHGLPYDLYTFKCDQCEFRTNNKPRFQKHTSKHTGSNFPCLKCGSFFDDNAKFLKHKKQHEESKYPCHICDKKYATSKSRSRHVNEKHKSKTESDDSLSKTELKKENIE